jgi:hypothetical protein
MDGKTLVFDSLCALTEVFCNKTAVFIGPLFYDLLFQFSFKDSLQGKLSIHIQA